MFSICKIIFYIEEKLKIRPNIHRWRRLADTQPENFNDLQRVSDLNRDFIDKTRLVKTPTTTLTILY